MLKTAIFSVVLALASPALAQGTNVYGGYDIAAAPGSAESPYGTARDWNVVSGTVGGKFAYCAGEMRDGGTVWRLGHDGLQWQLAVPYAPAGAGDWQGAYEVDGDNRPASGIAANGWTFMWMGLDDLDRIRNGNHVILDIGRASIDHPLRGTAAVITKIEECLARNGNAAPAIVAAAPPAPGFCAERLPGTGLCPEQASDLIGRPAPSEPFYDYYAHCTWAVAETPFAGGDYLLYYAPDCRGRRSQLEFSGGAQFAELNVVESAFAEGQFTPYGYPLVRIADASTGDPAANVLARARAAIEDKARAQMCIAIPGTEWGYPADSYVIDVSPQDAASLSEDERMSGACGPFGLGDSAKFWRVFQGFAWFFDLGQDAVQDVDAASLTLVTSDGRGGWKRAQ